MRISDWSSDVCSSDLSAARALLPGDLRRQGVVRIMRPFSGVLRRRRWPAAGTKSGVSTKMAEQAPEVGIIMGSQSDWPTMRHAADVLHRLGIAYEVRIVSAHRTPQRPVVYAPRPRAARPPVDRTQPCRARR